MCFSRNKRLDSLRKWCFKGFTTEDSPWFKQVPLLPLRPTYAMRQWMTYYDPEWEIRVNASHILEDEENAARLPESIRSAWNLPLLLETAVELARRKAMTDWSLAVPQIFQSRVQYLLPIHLTNMERPDLAMALSIMEGYYIGHTCLTLEMAYQNARLLGPAYGWVARRAGGVIRRRLAGKEFLWPRLYAAPDARKRCFSFALGISTHLIAYCKGCKLPGWKSGARVQENCIASLGNGTESERGRQILLPRRFTWP